MKRWFRRGSTAQETTTSHSKAETEVSPPQAQQSEPPDQRVSDYKGWAAEKIAAGDYQAIEADLDRNFSTDLVDLLIQTGDERALPTLKEVITRYGHILNVVGKLTPAQEFVAKLDQSVREEIGEEIAHRESQRQRLESAREEVRGYNEVQMITALRSLCAAYTSNLTEAIDKLEPVATAIGERLDDAGGINEMRRIFAQLQDVRGARTLEMHWSGIGAWGG